MQIKQIIVTKQMAEGWLQRNHSNRKLRPTYVKELALAMDRGEWMTNHQPIAVASGRLIDGQHRLHALCASNLPSLPMMVTLDADEKTFDTIDIGQKRSFADVLGISARAAGPVTLIARFVIDQRITPKQLEPVWQKLGKLATQIDDIKPSNSRLSSSAVRAGLICAILGDSSLRDDMIDLYRRLANYETQGLPRSMSGLIRQLALQERGRTQQEVMMRAYLAFLPENRDITKLTIRDPGKRNEALRKMLRKALRLTGSETK